MQLQTELKPLTFTPLHTLDRPLARDGNSETQRKSGNSPLGRVAMSPKNTLLQYADVPGTGYGDGSGETPGDTSGEVSGDTSGDTSGDISGDISGDGDAASLGKCLMKAEQHATASEHVHHWGFSRQSPEQSQ